MLGVCIALGVVLFLAGTAGIGFVIWNRFGGVSHCAWNGFGGALHGSVYYRSCRSRTQPGGRKRNYTKDLRNKTRRVFKHAGAG